ncbi:MAG TPA: hypothetical protein VJ201_04025, partial [Candidatus Babeliales bacterium]|nr:hypothetical protein [Candidatus Babeliales bacterium]
LSYYQQALEQQNDIFVAASAYELLAHMYSKGYPGIAVDAFKAIGYMQMIIDKKLGLIDQQIRACILLGDLYREGLLGMTADREKAINYYQKAAAYQGRVLIHDASINQRLKWAEDPHGAPKIQNTSDILF